MRRRWQDAGRRDERWKTVKDERGKGGREVGAVGLSVVVVAGVVVINGQHERL